MNLCIVRVATVAVLFSAFVPASWLGAQEAVLSEFYGTGVHQYFARNYDQADSFLAAAINGGSKDPRPYYYRALVDLRLGRSPNANLQKAAALESADINQIYPVGKSLERVQGAQRMTIERYRQLARAEAHQRQLRRDAARYEERKRAEAEVLRPGVTPPPSEKVPPVPAPAADAEDPFAEDAKPAAEPPAAEPPDTMPAEDAPPAAEPGDDPFTDQPAAEAEMPDDKPAAEEPADATDKKEEPAAADENPFGADESKDEK